MRRDARAAFAHSLEKPRKISVRRWHADAPVRCVADSMKHARRRNKRFARHAPEVQAIAPHFVALDERDTPAQSRRSGCYDKSRRSCADHDYVVNTPLFVLIAEVAARG